MKIMKYSHCAHVRTTIHICFYIIFNHILCCDIFGDVHTHTKHDGRISLINITSSGRSHGND